MPYHDGASSTWDKETMLKNKTTLFIIFATLLGVLLLILISFACYHYISKNRKKGKNFPHGSFNSNKESIEYDSLKFTYDTNIEPQQTNLSAELAHQNVQYDIPGDDSTSSESNFDESERRNLIEAIDLVQPPTVASSSTSSSISSELVDVLLIDRSTGSNNLGRSHTHNHSHHRHGLGRLSASMFFDKTLGLLRVNVIQWNDISSKSMKSTLSPYVKVQLLPDFERKYFTKTKRGENPVFDEEFSFPLLESELYEKSIHFSVCDFDKFSRQNILGNGIIRLDQYLEKLSLPEGTGVLWVNLTESDKTSSHNKGEISFSLSYYPTTNRITLTVIRAKDLNVDDTESRIAVKAKLMFDGKVVKTRKTSYHHTDLTNPTFNESWPFDIPHDALERTSFVLCVYAYSVNSKRVIGTASSGSHVHMKSGIAQWNEMLLQRWDPILYWHKLV